MELTELGFDVTVEHEDADAYWEASMERVMKARADSKIMQSGGFDFGVYHKLEDIYQFENDVVANYTFAFAETIGVSVEGRAQSLVKLCYTGRCENNIPTMFIECSKLII